MHPTRSFRPLPVLGGVVVGVVVLLGVVLGSLVLQLREVEGRVAAERAAAFPEGLSLEPYAVAEANATARRLLDFGQIGGYEDLPTGRFGSWPDWSEWATDALAASSRGERPDLDSYERWRAEHGEWIDDVVGLLASSPPPTWRHDPWEEVDGNVGLGHRTLHRGLMLETLSADRAGDVERAVRAFRAARASLETLVERSDSISMLIWQAGLAQRQQALRLLSLEAVDALAGIEEPDAVERTFRVAFLDGLRDEAWLAPDEGESGEPFEVLADLILRIEIADRAVARQSRARELREGRRCADPGPLRLRPRPWRSSERAEWYDSGPLWRARWAELAATFTEKVLALRRAAAAEGAAPRALPGGDDPPCDGARWRYTRLADGGFELVLDLPEEDDDWTYRSPVAPLP